MPAKVFKFKSLRSYNLQTNNVKEKVSEGLKFRVQDSERALTSSRKKLSQRLMDLESLRII